MPQGTPRSLIRVNELRIGNVVGEIGTQRMFRVRSISKSAVMVNNGSNGETTWLAENKLIPVALRAELLERLRFKPSQADRSHTLELSEGLIKVVDCKDVFIGGYGSLTEGLSFHCTITSLHQFQNLYFSLTGMEAILF